VVVVGLVVVLVETVLRQLVGVAALDGLAESLVELLLRLELRTSLTDRKIKISIQKLLIGSFFVGWEGLK